MVLLFLLCLQQQIIWQLDHIVLFLKEREQIEGILGDQGLQMKYLQTHQNFALRRFAVFGKQAICRDLQMAWPLIAPPPAPASEYPP